MEQYCYLGRSKMKLFEATTWFCWTREAILSLVNGCIVCIKTLELHYQMIQFFPKCKDIIVQKNLFFYFKQYFKHFCNRLKWLSADIQCYNRWDFFKTICFLSFPAIVTNNRIERSGARPKMESTTGQRH